MAVPQPPAFENSPDGERVWRRSKGPAVGSALAALLIAVIACGLSGLGLALLPREGSRGAGVTLLILAALMVGLALYCWRDARGKWGGAITLRADEIVLDLPAERSLIHRPPTCRERIARRDIAGIETRLEAYRAQGGANMQRAYWLVRRSGGAVLLFEDRAIGTRIETASLEGVALEIAGWAGVPYQDLGMAEGKGGLLGVAGTAPAGREAPAIGPDREGRMWRRVRLTGAAAGLVALVVTLAQLL